MLGYAANGAGDELALAMLAHLVDDLPIRVEIAATRMQAAELIALAQTQPFGVVCIADLPPSPASKTRYLVKRLRAALPEALIVVGRWAPPALTDGASGVAGCRASSWRPRCWTHGPTSPASWQSPNVAVDVAPRRRLAHA